PWDTSAASPALHVALPILEGEPADDDGRQERRRQESAGLTETFRGGEREVLPAASGDHAERADIQHHADIADGDGEQTEPEAERDRKSTRLNSSHVKISYA